MIIKLLLVTLLFKSFWFSPNEKYLVTVIDNLIKLQKRPAQVTGFICGRKNHVLQYFKTISVDFQTQILNANSSNVDFLQPDVYHFIILDLQCNGSKHILKKSHYLGLFKSPFRWLFYGKNSKITLTDYYFGQDSSIFHIKTENNQFYVNSIYKLNNNSDHFIENYITSWSASYQGFTHLNAFSTIQNRSNLMGSEITLSYVINDLDSEKHIWDYKFKDRDTMSKVNYILIYYICEILNATLRTKIASSWGYLNKTTNVFYGMYGDLQSGQALISGTPGFISRERLEVVDFIAATTPTRVRFIFRAPPLSYAINVYTHPFITNVWYALCIIMILILIIIYVTFIWEWKGSISREQYYKPSVFDIILMEIGATTQQGSEIEPKSLSGRIAMIFCFIMLMFLYTAYSANIVVLLQSTSNSIQEVEDLLKTRIKIGADDVGGYNQFYFKEEKEPIRRSLYETKMTSTNPKSVFMTAEEGIAKVRNEFFAFHMEVGRAYTLISKTFQEYEKCGLTEIDYLNLHTTFISIRKNSTLKELIKIRFRQLHESGVQTCQILRLYEKKPKCTGRVTNFVSVDLYDCYAAFMVFGVGLLCSVLVMLVEILIHKYYKK